MKSVLLITLLSASAAFAANPIFGDIKFGGQTVSIRETGIDFTLPGYVARTSGDFEPIDRDTTSYFSDFEFDANGELILPDPAVPTSPDGLALGFNTFWAFEQDNVRWEFALEKFTYNKVQGSRRELEGNGIIRMTGKDDTFGTIEMSFSGIGANGLHKPYQIEIESSCVAVPEPDAAAMLGFVAMGLLLYRPRR